MNDTTIRAMARLVHETAKAKGWWDDFPTLCHACGFYTYREPCESCACGVSKLRPTADERDFALRTITLLALVTTEVAEAIECVREGKYHEWTRENGKPEGLPSELADVDIAAAIDRKHAFNATRSVRHGGKLA